MAELLASLDDVNTHLPTDKLEAEDGIKAINLYQVDVNTIIKGGLSSVFSVTTLAAWADPSTTPPYIRSIAGRLIAAFWYANRRSEQMADWDRSFPQRIYNEAMAMLDMVRQGLVDLGLTEESGVQFSNLFFIPNATTTAPKFTMDSVF